MAYKTPILLSSPHVFFSKKNLSVLNSGDVYLFMENLFFYQTLYCRCYTITNVHKTLDKRIVEHFYISYLSLDASWKLEVNRLYVFSV